MIKHIVCWQLKNRENEKVRGETAAAIKQKIENIRGRILGLLHIENSVDISGAADSKDVVLNAELESCEALAGYHVYPAHLEFKSFIGGRCSEGI